MNINLRQMRPPKKTQVLIGVWIVWDGLTRLAYNYLKKKNTELVTATNCLNEDFSRKKNK